MEAGGLSNKKFQEFARQVVPFLSVMTHIEGQPYDNLLLEKGGSGFPTLMFLTAEGDILQRHRGVPTPKGFQESFEEVKAYLDLSAKAEQGDQKAATAVFLRQLRNEWYDFEEASKRAKGLQKVSKAQEREIEQLLINTEVRSIAEKAGKAGRLDAGKHFASMFEKGRIPSSEDQLYPYWSLMALHAETAKDKRLFSKVVTQFESSLPGPRYARVLEGLKQRLSEL